MAQVSIERIAEAAGGEATVRGWLYNQRSSGKLLFLLVRDGTGILQAVVSRNDVGDGLFALAEGLTQETSLEITGRIREDKRAPGGFEMTVTSLAVVGASGEYPIGPKDHGVDFLMDHRHLWLRSSRPHATLRIRHEFLQGIRDFLYENGFINVDTPVLTPAACEGTTTLFETDYFDTKAYLTQSGQLYNEATAMAFGKVYCFGPTFRAEKAKTRRHLIEFWMVEPEMAYATLDDAMDVAEALVVYLVERVRTRRARELEVLERDPKALEAVKPPFPRISYGEAVERLHAAGHDFGWGNDFGAADETVLSRGFDRPFFVHRFPAAVKAFYMKRDPGDERLALGADLLAPEGYGEIVGGGQREDDLETLERRIAEHGLPRSAFEWYLDLRRYGSVPHSGFGLGIERTLAWICGVDHVRETIPFPRLLNRMTP
jgi:asparaginyl-tRNA synthetase